MKNKYNRVRDNSAFKDFVEREKQNWREKIKPNHHKINTQNTCGTVTEKHQHKKDDAIMHNLEFNSDF